MWWLWMLAGCNDPAVVQPTVAPADVQRGSKSLLPEDRRMTFDGLAWDDAWLTARRPTATKRASVDFKDVPIDFHELGRPGVDGFGTRLDLAGQPIDEVCNEQDFNAMFEAKGKLWLTSHFECTPGGITLSELAQDEHGDLVIKSSRPVDFTREGGIYNPCAGQVTPWGSHLASEEYEPNAVSEPESLETHGWDYISWTEMKKHTGGKTLNAYDYGWIPEVNVLSPAGDTLTRKHYSMGRFSHEIAYVLPDRRTVYLSDDGTGVGWFMFVADRAGDLTSGKLYAAKYSQKSPTEGNVQWVPLGTASDQEILGAIQAGITFQDLFELRDPTGVTCPEGFTYIDADARKECLKLVEDGTFGSTAKLASRLETRRFAAMRGATTEFQKGEGVTYDEKAGVVYLALAKLTDRMVEEPDQPHGHDHIQMAANPCGGVMAGYTRKGLRDSMGQPIDSEHVIAPMRLFVAGTPLAEPDAQGNTCARDGLANPDNITYLPDYDVLMIGEDTKRHTIASLWAYTIKDAKFTRVLAAPPHGEITGLHWIRDLNGFGYLTVAVQHPWRMESLTGETATLPEGVTEADKLSITGYLGPFPKLE